MFAKLPNLMPSKLKSSFIAIARRTKFIHIGITNNNNNMNAIFLFILDKINATGYAIRMQTIVTSKAIKRLIKSVVTLVVSLKNDTKLCKVKTPFASVKA